MNKQPSTALIICLTVVAAFMITATALIVITLDSSALPEGWLALFFGAVAGLVTALVTVGQVVRIGNQVDDLANGKMDAKIRAAVADVVKDEHLDPDAAEQIAADRLRRDQH